MPSLGPAEILVIFVVALLVLGPNRMPEVARQAGKAFRELRRAQQHLRSEVSSAFDDFDASEPPAAGGPASSAMAGGGDPVPMLPPKDPPSSPPASEPSTDTDTATHPGTPPAEPT